MTVTGPDISSHQHPPSRIDFRAVKAAGHSLVIVKATEGATYQSQYFRQDITDARAAGLAVGAYHWVSPTSPADAQARNFLATISGAIGPRDLPLALDFEQAGAGHATLDAIRAALQAAGWPTMTYTYPAFWSRNGKADCVNCGRDPLWFADYNAGHNRPAPAPWRDVALRQTHGTSYAVPGLPGLQDMSRVEAPGGLASLLGGATTGGGRIPGSGAPIPTPIPIPLPEDPVTPADIKAVAAATAALLKPTLDTMYSDQHKEWHEMRADMDALAAALKVTLPEHPA